MRLKPLLRGLSLHQLQPLQLLAVAESKQAMMLIGASSLATRIGMSNPSIDGSIVAFLVSFFISNKFPSLAIKSDKIISFGWSNVLIASLVIGMLGSNDEGSPSTAMNAIPMLVSFISGALGSFVGSIVAFNIVKKICSANILVSDLAICAGCLAASYIGGTSNFFETANVLVKNNSSTLKLLNIVAGIDIFVMVCYFMVLLCIRKIGIKDGTAQSKKPFHNSSDSRISHSNIAVLDIVKPGLLGMVVSLISSKLQKTIAIPGVSVTIATMLSLIIRKLDLRWVESISRDGRNLCSTFYLSIFYAILGGGLQFNDLVVGIPILSLISLTLLIHLGIMFISRLLWNHYFPKHTIDVDNLIISSNACIGGVTYSLTYLLTHSLTHSGGAATSAGMASQIGRNDLTIIASSLGILGYVIGTHFGLNCIKYMKY